MTLVQELNDLHTSYVEAINAAVARDDLAGAERLAETYDDEAVQLIAERENKTHLLPIRRPQSPDTSLRRLARRLRVARAA
ncbi:hypothetical protein [Nocardioides sp.]|jgi:hypothetical protein|uniref:hypothetical protein n=1 Tax=Nocardioides sp. TaxID=35761 RepID=UPI0031FF4713|nr:hypothetical protein [Nocardioides sp.]